MSRNVGHVGRVKVEERGEILIGAARPGELRPADAGRSSFTSRSPSPRDLLGAQNRKQREFDEQRLWLSHHCRGRPSQGVQNDALIRRWRRRMQPDHRGTSERRTFGCCAERRSVFHALQLLGEGEAMISESEGALLWIVGVDGGRDQRRRC